MVVVRRAFLLVLLALFFYGAWRLTSANAGPVDVDFILIAFHNIPLWAALGTSFVAGALITAATSSVEIARKSLTARRYRKTVGSLEAEVHQLRNLPLAQLEEPLEGSEAESGESDT